MGVKTAYLRAYEKQSPNSLKKLMTAYDLIFQQVYTSLLQNTILKIKYRMCGTVHKYYIPLLCTLLRLPGRQQHCRWTLSAGEGAHISSLVPSHSRSQRGQANLELPQGCLSLKVIDTCFIHEPHLLENRQV